MLLHNLCAASKPSSSVQHSSAARSCPALCSHTGAGLLWSQHIQKHCPLECYRSDIGSCSQISITAQLWGMW